MTTDPDKLVRIAQAHVTMATDLAAAIVRAGERRAATLAAGGVLDLADAVFAIDCLAAHVATNEAMLLATEGDYPAESVARVQRANQRLAEAVAEARAGLERGDDPLLVHTRLKLLIAVAAMQSPENNAPMDAIAAVGGFQPAERSLYGRSVQMRELRLDLTRQERRRLTQADQFTSEPVMLDPDAVQAGVPVTAHGTPIEYDDTPGITQVARTVTLDEDDGEP